MLCRDSIANPILARKVVNNKTDDTKFFTLNVTNNTNGRVHKAITTSTKTRAKNLR